MAGHERNGLPKLSALYWQPTRRLSTTRHRALGRTRKYVRVPEADGEEAMVQSLRRYGQLSPVVVCETEGRLLLLGGFKRHAAAGQVPGMDAIWSRRLQAEATTAKAANLHAELDRPAGAGLGRGVDRARAGPRGWALAAGGGSLVGAT